MATLPKELIYSTPEDEGVRSADILRLINFIEDNKINIHSLMLLRHGRVIAEGYVPPFDKSFLHRLYSATKTYVAVAVGMLVTEGKLKTSDRILDFFPEYDTDEVPEFMRECTVEHALMMSTPHLPVKPSENATRDNPYAAPCHKPSGALFAYNDGADILTRVVERVSGMELVEYMRPLFDKLGIGKMTRCIKDCNGGAWGGSGMLSTTEDFARFSLFIHNLAEMDGEQLIDREYMELMTSKRSESNVARNSYSPLVAGGYGYLTWITPDAVCMRGMGAQEAYCFRDKELIFICNGDTMTDGDFADIRLYDAVKYLIYDNITEPMPPSQDTEELARKLDSLSMPSYGAPKSSMAEAVSGKRWALEKNPMGWKWVEFDFADSSGSITYENSRGVKTVNFGLGEHICTTFPERHYYDAQRGVPSGRELNALTVAEWIEENKLLLRIYITDVSFGSIFALVSFKDGMITMQLNKRGEFILEDYGGWAIGNVANYDN